MIFDITPILMSMVAINANRADEDLSDGVKADDKEGDSDGGEFDFFFRYLTRAMCLALVIASIFLLIVLISRFLL